MVNAELTLTAASEVVLFGNRKEVRITTMVPETLYQSFSAFCRRKGGDVNSMLVSRIGPVVSEDGAFEVKRAVRWMNTFPETSTQIRTAGTDPIRSKCPFLQRRP